MIANWIVLGLLALGSSSVVVSGLIGKEEKGKTYGAAHVFVGCVLLVVCGFAAHGLWTRYGPC